ncbi:MAG TPA: oligosaccharide flippase family protein, partial [Caulobacteraceae bacterium]|nr:oligosaccharide flippase family protein [Caulobacteraceae bacterium]
MNERRMGALLGYALLVVSAGVAFFFTPFLIGQLGKVQYGLYAIVGSLAAYFMLLDLGLNDTVVRYIVRYRREADEAGLANFMAIMLGVYACIALALAAIGAGVYAALPQIFGAAMSPAEVDLLRQMFLIVLAGGALTIALNPFSGVLVAHERFVLVRGLDILLQLLSAAAAVAVLLAGFEAVGLVLATTVAALAAVLFKTAYALVRLGVKVRFTGIPPGLMREVAAYAAPIFVVVVVELIYWRLDNIIIGSMLGAAAVAVYAVAISFQKHFQRLAGAITRVMYPSIVHAIEGGISDADLTQLMVRISRAQAVVLLPVLVGMVVFGREFLNLWLGADFEAAYPIMLITMLPYALELIGSGRNMVLQVKGLYWIRAGMTRALSLLNVAVTVALIPYLGILGAAIGTGLGAALGAA